jgi:small subunit ribosomal protein S4
MGHPKFHRSKFSRPQKPYDKARLTKEKKIMQQYGLRRKHELWRAGEILRDFRARARDLLGKPDEKTQKELFDKLSAMGIKADRLEDVLGISLEALLARRLQSVLVKRGMAATQKQARQLIVHNHVSVDGQKVRWASYLVPVELEGKIDIEPAIKAKMVEASKK